MRCEESKHVIRPQHLEALWTVAQVRELGWNGLSETERTREEGVSL